MSYKLFKLNGDFIKESNSFYSNFTGIVEYSDSSKEWFLNGQCHRWDGPAWEAGDGPKSWHVYGKHVSKEQHALLVDIMKLKGLL